MNRSLTKKTLFLSTLIIAVFYLISGLHSEEVEQKTTITYTVQKGDTLWGLSQKFFDSAWYWPGLWAENSKITNPHWIYPGQEITLYSKKAIAEIQEKENQPVSQIVQTIKKENIAKIEKQDKKPNFVFRKINKLPYISTREIKPDATIQRGVTPVDMYSTGDEIYITAENGSEKFLIGEKYAIYKKPEKVFDPDNKKIFIGYQYNLAGIIEILKKEGQLLRAVITNTYRPISNGDLITEFNEISPDIFLKPSVAGLKGKIIKEKEGAIYLGEHFIGFINAGTADGVERGQIYSIVEEQIVSLGNKETFTELIPIGSFVVVDAREKVSAVLIIESEKQIPTGALFISPSM
ncbi:MAG: LysM peptidoglycan-binding domain-containing protein [Desulfobacteraceae bacterium]|nr:LysM peptidoglycan-binding domain-containing protein [Desulfobacteraceae bacterium]MCB9494604.1 LysM peptidoglycan-binding domain-containing protein [Desulfobacteraceae bacterium]